MFSYSCLVFLFKLLTRYIQPHYVFHWPNFPKQLEGETGEDEEREARLFPDPDQADMHITDHALTADFLVYSTDVSYCLSWLSNSSSRQHWEEEKVQSCGS